MSSCAFHDAIITINVNLIYIVNWFPKVRERFCKTLDEMCKDWMGRVMEYEIQFECLIDGCKRRYPLKLCDDMKIVHQCEQHNINLNAVREMFG